MQQQQGADQGDTVPNGGIRARPATRLPGDMSEAAALWHPVDELAHLDAELARLRQRRDALVDMFLTPGADCRFEGLTHVVEVVAESRRTFDRRRLPAAILQDVRFYAVTTCRNVRLVAKLAEPEDTSVIEPLH